VSPRQQTLRATMDWSWELLGEQEQALLRRLSVFAGSWTLLAAEAVSTGDSNERWTTLDLLDGLATKSLVGLDETGAEARYRLLETVRHYAGERLAAAGESTAARDRHLIWYLTLAEDVESRLSGPELRLWLGRLETKIDNLRAAMGWAREQGDGARFLRLTGALWRFWLLRGYFSEGRGWLEAALQMEGAQDMPAVRARALAAAGALACEQGDDGRAAVVLEEALELWRTLEDVGGAANSLHNQGIVAYFQSDHVRAVTLLGEALRLSHDIGDKDLTTEGLEGLAWVAVTRGQPERAARLGGAAEAQRAGLVVPLEQDKQAGHAQMVQAIRATLGEEALARAWAEGWALSLEEAVALALTEDKERAE